MNQGNRYYPELATNVALAALPEVVAGTSAERIVANNLAINRQAVSDLSTPDLLSSRQSLHIPPVTDGRSVLTSDPVELLQGLHEGQFSILRQTKPGSVIVDFGKPIGEYWNVDGFVGETNFGTVSYGKKGAHIIPANPNQW